MGKCKIGLATCRGGGFDPGSGVVRNSDPVELALRAPAVQAVARRVERGGVFSLGGVALAAQPFLAAMLGRLFPGRPLLVVVPGSKGQESFHQDLLTWERWGGGGEAVPLFYPPWDVLPHEARLPHSDVLSERLEALVALERWGRGEGVAGRAPVLVASVAALLQPTFAPGVMKERTRVLRKGDRLDPLDLAEWLEDEGYEPEVKVTQKGEISLRGGIFDLFPLTRPWPVRLEFFGDELDSMREFDPTTQLSRGEVESVVLAPAGELGFLRRMTEGPAGGGSGSGGGSMPAMLLEHLGPGAILLLCDPLELKAHADEYLVQVPEGHPLRLGWEAVLARAAELGCPRLLVEEWGGDVAEAVEPSLDVGQELELRLPGLEWVRPMGERAPDAAVAEAQRREFFGQVGSWVASGQTVFVVCNNEGERQRFGEIWREHGLTGVEPVAWEGGDGGAAGVGRLWTVLGTLARGFQFSGAGFVVVTDAEIFGRYKVQRPRRLKSPHAAAVRSAFDIDFSQLEEGDLVVHLQNGIGRYQGLKLLPAGAGTRGRTSVESESGARGGGQECLVIEYAPPEPGQPAPRLYVPVTESHLVSKYVGAGRIRPPLNTLGGTRWAKTKAQAEHAVRDLASELLAIQAARASQPGHAFGEDTPWQREFEGSFVYEETPDQVRAIEATKRDMESSKPMDRLVCGDVGFGKTEVAIRSAFKAVMAGKQVAVLVPTTVLAQQHFNTFRERMADYPVRVELLSRFRTRREQVRVLEALAAGDLDIVVGTHRLVQADVEFKDLGLVVIDEEQRFGVAHKERFKLLRRMVDVLTLSATPIPRTLHLALTGARDLSTIETPPQDRLPVETVVTHYDERVVRDAIQRELNREGQVYFLHNRVTTIDAMALKLKSLLPQARIVVGHGQMDADDLERVMTQFVNGEADVLLSTTIIESGLDIPNANTIIIDRADRFGLSQLYQLRGRVGRYKHQAYAYLLLPRHATLLADVRKRITALKQYSSLGSGFKIAMRDLEIRGAGSILGAQQSGHIAAVGFDLYCQLLKQSITTLKGGKAPLKVAVVARLDFLETDPSVDPAAGRSESEEEELGGKVEREPALRIHVPREGGMVHEGSGRKEEVEREVPIRRAWACLPLEYVREPDQRIELHRRLAQLGDTAGLAAFKEELKDRFGRVPAAVDRLILLQELKVLAGERGVTLVETRGDKLMLQRNGDWIMMEGKFPRLTKREAGARLREIRRLLGVLS